MQVAKNGVPEEKPPLYNRCRFGKPHKIQRRHIHGQSKRRVLKATTKEAAFKRPPVTK